MLVAPNCVEVELNSILMLLMARSDTLHKHLASTVSAAISY